MHITRETQDTMLYIKKFKNKIFQIVVHFVKVLQVIKVARVPKDIHDTYNIYIVLQVKFEHNHIILFFHWILYKKIVLPNILLLIRHPTFCENHALDNIFQYLLLGICL
jgi:hypothetical protein